MEPLHTTLRLGILLLVLTCSMGVTAQTSKTAQNRTQVFLGGKGEVKGRMNTSLES